LVTHILLAKKCTVIGDKNGTTKKAIALKSNLDYYFSSFQSLLMLISVGVESQVVKPSRASGLSTHQQKATIFGILPTPPNLGFFIVPLPR